MDLYETILWCLGRKWRYDYRHYLSNCNFTKYHTFKKLDNVTRDDALEEMKPYNICKTLVVGQRIKKVVFKQKKYAIYPISCSNESVLVNDIDGKQIVLDWDFGTRFNYTDVESIEL